MEKPKIRFKGYQEDWEQRKFGDYNDLMTGYPFESDKFSEDGIKLVRGMNVKRGYLDFSEDICVKWNSCVGLENFLLKDGDILIQMDGALIGKSYAKIKENQLPALLVQRVTRARTNNKFASQDFMYQTIQRDFLRYIEMNKTETAVPHLSLNDIRNFEIMVPCLAEQKKIGDYFESLDHLITLHQRKCEEMKTLKKYMLQKMFPQNGQLVPQIRFSGFTEDWEQRKLGELAEIVGGGTPSTSVDSYWDGDIDWYAPAEIGEQIYLKSSQRKITEEGLNKSSAKVLPVGTVLFTSRAGIGKTAILLKEGCTNQGFQSIVPNKNKLDSYFIFTRSEELKRYGETVGAGSTFVEVSGKQMANMELMMPTTMDEQQKIGEYFSNLDNLITLHQQKCDELRNIKKFMLQNMFI